MPRTSSGRKSRAACSLPLAERALSNESLNVSTTDGVAEVVLVGPGRGNAMGPPFFRELPAVFAELDRDDAVRTVIVRGKDGIFSYGLDLKAMAPELMTLLAPENLASER